MAFGFARDSSGFRELAQFADVRLLFFPVYSPAGPVWVTCTAVLRDAGLSVDTEPADDQVKLAAGLKVAT